MKASKTHIEFKNISLLTLEELMEKLLQANKLKLENAHIDDFAISASLTKTKIHEFNYKKLFGYGVYILFENKQPVYVGMTVDNFFHRILSHCNTDLQAFWGWNALLKKIACAQNRNKKTHELTENDLKAAVEKLKTFELIRINVQSDNWNKVACKKLEKLLMKGFKHKGYELFNTRFGHLSLPDLTKRLNTLIC